MGVSFLEGADGAGNPFLVVLQRHQKEDAQTRHTQIGLVSLGFSSRGPPDLRCSSFGFGLNGRFLFFLGTQFSEKGGALEDSSCPWAPFWGKMAVGQNQWYHFGVGAPPILVYFSWDWDVHWGYDLDFDPWPSGGSHARDS